LHNEASVETFFVNRLLEELGYRDSQIQTKKPIIRN
jgi:type I restriction enzyme M protein